MKDLYVKYYIGHDRAEEIEAEKDPAKRAKKYTLEIADKLEFAFSILEKLGNLEVKKEDFKKTNSTDCVYISSRGFSLVMDASGEVTAFTWGEL